MNTASKAKLWDLIEMHYTCENIEYCWTLHNLVGSIFTRLRLMKIPTHSTLTVTSTSSSYVGSGVE